MVTCYQTQWEMIEFTNIFLNFRFHPVETVLFLIIYHDIQTIKGVQ